LKKNEDARIIRKSIKNYKAKFQENKLYENKPTIKFDSPIKKSNRNKTVSFSNIRVSK
jgi:hypothetical protein